MSSRRFGRLAGPLTLVACLLAASCGLVAPPSKPAVAQVVRLDGEAKVKRAGAPKWERAVEDMQLQVGDRLWATMGTVDVAFPSSGERQRLMANTIIEIKPPVRMP